MKKIIAWLLVLTLTAAVSIGATLAYLTDTDEDVNVMTLGKVKIEQLEYERIDDETANEDAEVQEFQNNKPLYPAVTDKNFDYTPGDSNVDWEQIGKDGYTSEIWDPSKINNEIDKMVFVKNKGDYDAFVRCVMAFEAAPDWSFDDFQSKVHLNLNDTDWTWQWVETPVSIGEGTYFVAVVTYNDVLKPGAFTKISLSQIALDKTATNEDLKALGDTYNVLVKSQGIQADGFETAVMALDDGFGAITASAVPFTTDQPPKGIDLRSALRFYQGDETQPIDAKVTSVVFGRIKDYPAIVNNYTGTLVTDEQNVDVHAYYVPNGSKYDVYLLANGTIYAPEDSSELFYKMSSLKTVDTSNLDVSHVKNMYRLFSYCTALEELDVSNWDVSNVVNMEHAFSHLEVLEELDVSKWKPSSATTFRYMFGYNYKIKELDVSKWDTSNVTNTEMMFRDCDAVTELNLSGWNTAKLVNAPYMFYQSGALKTVDVTGWNTDAVTSTKSMFYKCTALESVPGIKDWTMKNNTTLYFMFQECKNLKSIDVSGWDTSNVTTIQGTFYKCSALETVTGLGNWNTSKVTDMSQFCEGARSLKSVSGIGNFQTGNVTTMYHMFYGCTSLEELDVSRWDTGKVTSFRSMFSSNGQNTGDMKFKDLDVENWDVSSATDMSHMFYGCGELTELDLSKWDVSNVTTMYHMFTDCIKMERYNFSGWDTSKVTVVNGMFNSNRALKTIDLSDFDTQNIQDFSQLFDGASALETVIGMDKWDTSSGLYYVELFTGTKVKEVDLSSFDMTTALRTDTMFSGNSELTTIYVGDNWNLDPARLENSGGMFGGNPKLTGANGTTTAGNPTDATYARVDTPAVVDAEGNVITEAVPGYLTYKAAPEAP